MSRRALSLCLVVGATAGCLPTTTDDTGPFRTAVLESWGTRVLMPLHEALAADTLALADAAAARCADPALVKEAGVVAMRDAWSAAHGSMKRLEVVRFGLQVDFPDRLGPTLDFWPARPDRVATVLIDDSPLTAERFAAEGAVLRGLPVLEVLLWPAADAPAADVAALYAVEPRRCAYLVAASEDAARLGARLRDAWLPSAGNFLGEVTAPPPGGFFAGSTLIAFSELVNRLGFSAENVRRDKLGRTSADAVEASPSDRSAQAMLDVLGSVRLLALGGAASTIAEAEADDAVGLLEHPRFVERPDLKDAFLASLDGASAAIVAMPHPFRDAITSDPAAVAAAADALQALQVTIQVDVMNVLGLTLSFNDADGD